MLRRGGLIMWVVAGWCFHQVWLQPARAQVELLPPVTAPAAQPALYSVPRHDPSRAAASQGPTDVDVQAVERPPHGLLLQEPLSYSPPSCEPLPSEAVPGELAWRRDCYTWQVLPSGLLYKTYLAGGREPRFASQWINDPDYGWMWEIALGGRVGLVRYGTSDETYPEGWQMDFEGAVFPRLDLDQFHDRELMGADYRVGVPWTYRRGPWETKFGYYHLSSHMGDEYIATHPWANRINYVRDCLGLGVALRPHPDLRLYTEAGWAFYTDGGAEPWEFQFGVDYSPMRPWGIFGSPFFAINGHIREEVDFGGGLTVHLGWQWRGQAGHLFRAGMLYFNGMSDQREFFTQHDELVGLAVWYDQ